jgi:hypothetical protein
MVVSMIISIVIKIIIVEENLLLRFKLSNKNGSANPEIITRIIF